jgi:sulfonate transport system substrate-binding protein
MKTILSRRALLAGALAASAAAALAPLRRAGAAGVDKIGVDYAYYNPPSLILKKYGWLEEALAPLGTKVEWVLSLGSNKANQFLAASAVQFGSTAGSAALLARANGSPIHTVYLFSQPEWTALVVGKDSQLQKVSDLRGKKIAATKGTDPYFFLLRALATAGLAQGDVEIVELQHPDGRQALERGQVDAWAGLDPHMAASQLDAGSRLLYRNRAFNTYGALNSREDFLHDHPEIVTIVLRQYERARQVAKNNVDETIKIVAEASGLEPRVAALQLRERTSYPNPTPGVEFHRALEGVIPIVRANQLALPTADLDGALASLAETGPSKAAHV